MEYTKFTANQKTWWIIKGEFPSAGVLDSGSTIETTGEFITYNVRSKWEIEKKKIPNLVEKSY